MFESKESEKDRGRRRGVRRKGSREVGRMRTGGRKQKREEHVNQRKREIDR